MAKAQLLFETGGPEVFTWSDIKVEAPAEGQVRLRHTAVGLNYIDTYHRSGLYPIDLPTVIGSEGVGVVEAVGAGVSLVKPGERVGYAGVAGSYAEERLIPADRLVKIPDGVSDRDAAALMLKGMTVEYLFHRTYRVGAGQTILFHAAAGGVGLIACQWAKALGVRLIGTAGGPDKVARAKAAGAEHVIDYNAEDFVARLMELTDGRGVSVVYDSVGKDTFERSIGCLAPRGMLVSFGQSSGPVPPVNLAVFAPKAAYYTRPSLAVYNRARNDLEASAAKLFEMVASGAVKADIGQTWPLAEVQAAHTALEGRRTQGATILTVGD
ncbi:MAG: quinone oxidoreductase [Alphaproteobacteria bacterium]